MNPMLSHLPLAVREIVCHYAIRRGIAGHQLEEFLNPQLDFRKLELPNLDLASARLAHAIRKNEQVVIFGDYDADGITATSILVRFFNECTSLRPKWILPNRQSDCYGLGLERAKSILTIEKPQLLVTLDCGTNSAEATSFLRAHGIDTLVVDHHPPQQDLATGALAVINPKLHGPCSGEATDLCAAGLTLMLCYHLAQVLGAQDRWDQEAAIIMAGLGTLGDACVMTHLNRVLVKSAMHLINTSGAVARSPGLRALLPDAGAFRVHQRVLEFDLIPKLNALGRLSLADPGVELLTTEDAALARQLAAKAAGINSLRQQLQQRVVESAAAQAGAKLSEHPETKILILSDPAWHHGVVGPAASRTVERFGRSAILIGLDGAGMWRGSGRSYGRDDLGTFVTQLRRAGFLAGGGGHAGAVGVMATGSQLARLHKVSPEFTIPQTGSFEAETEVIAEVDLLEPSEWRQVLELLEPFGRRNPLPLLTAQRCLMETTAEPLRCRDGTTWAAKAELRTRRGRTLSVLWRDHVRASHEWKPGRRYDLELELSWRPTNGRIYYNWAVASSRPARQ